MLAGCGAKEADPVAVNVGAMKGPTAMGMVKMMEDDESGATAPNDYNFSLLASPDEVTPMLVKGELDIAALPANLTAVLYQNMEQNLSVSGSQYTGCHLYCGRWGHRTVCGRFERKDHLCFREGFYAGI